MNILTRKEFQDDMAKMWSEAVHAEYKAQIDEAVAAEREACAKVCEEMRPSKAEYDQRFYDGCTFSAAAIRAREQA